MTGSFTGIWIRPRISRTSSGRGSVHSTKSSAVTERRKHDEQSKNNVTRQEGRPRVLTCRDDPNILFTARPLYLLLLLFLGVLTNPCAPPKSKKARAITDHGPSVNFRCFGNPAIPGGPVAFRPTIARGLALSAAYLVRFDI